MCYILYVKVSLRYIDFEDFARLVGVKLFRLLLVLSLVLLFMISPWIVLILASRSCLALLLQLLLW